MHTKVRYRSICLLFITVTLLMTLPLVSQAEIKAMWGVRGEVWGMFSKSQKLLYMTGALDGMSFAEKDDQITYSTSCESYIKALDQFYEDYRNELIPAIYALQIASMEMQGEDKEKVEKHLRFLRALFHDERKKRTQQKDSGDKQ